MYLCQLHPLAKHGVLTLQGYGIGVSIAQGHLLLEDGIGPHRRKLRLPRVGHGLKRLIIIGSDGFVSLAALRWLADQDAAFILLERDGKVLAVTGPVRPSDACLRRAQALAQQSGVALQITRELISQKLAGQEQVARHRLLDGDRLHEVKGQAVTSRCVNVEHAKTGIKPERGSRKSSFRLKQGVEVIQNRVDRTGGQPRRPRQRRNTSAKRAPVIGYFALIASRECNWQCAPRRPISVTASRFEKADGFRRLGRVQFTTKPGDGVGAKSRLEESHHLP
jgi:hypothetical protein